MLLHQLKTIADTQEIVNPMGCLDISYGWIVLFICSIFCADKQAEAANVGEK